MVSEHMPVARLRAGGRASTPTPAPHSLPPAKSTGAGGGAQASALAEWHAMSSTGRKAAWIELVDWVVWLYDRYELAVEHRLPACWAEHPGLIEELWALKIWREQIYAAQPPSGQAARYWHNELRQVLHAAATQYAKGCRAGHKTATALAAADQELRRRWLGADPLIGVPPNLLTVTAPIAGEGTAMSDPQMRAAIDAGLTRPVGAHIGEHQHYQGHWWTLLKDSGLWQQIIDPLVTAELDAAADRMKIADTTVDNQPHRDPLT